MDDDGTSDDAMWQIGVFDSHCHPIELMASVDEIAKMKAKVLTVMSTRSQDQHLAEQAASRYPVKDSKFDFTNDGSKYVIPAFGWHPWFSFQLFDDSKWGEATPDRKQHYASILTPVPDDDEFLREMPAPISLQQALQETERRLAAYQFALIGEVGLDRGFRLPYGPMSEERKEKLKYGGSKERHTEGSRNGRPLSPYKINIDHQKGVLRAQLGLAAKMRRPVSVHSVQAHGLVFDLIQSLWKGYERPSKREQKRATNIAAQTSPNDKQHDLTSNDSKETAPFPPRICMHSYSGTADTLKQFLAPPVPADIYFSFSIVVNFSNESSKALDVIKAVPDDRILIESDLHRAGDAMDELLEQIIQKVCEVKGWKIDHGARTLRENWLRFVFG